MDLLCSRHNSSTTNRAGNDVDTQCTFGRGIPARRAAALMSQVMGSVTEIAPQHIVWRAEESHQQYLKKSGHMGSGRKAAKESNSVWHGQNWPSKRHMSTGCLAAFKSICAEQQAYLVCLKNPKHMQATAADGSLPSAKQRCVLHTCCSSQNVDAACYLSLRDRFNGNEVPQFFIESKHHVCVACVP